MTQVFDDKRQDRTRSPWSRRVRDGHAVKTEPKDGYDAVQVGFGTCKRLNKPMRGHLKKLGDFRMLREFRAVGDGDYTRRAIARRGTVR